MMTARFVQIAKAGGDYVQLYDGDDCLKVNLADDWMLTKEEWAACFRGKEGKTVAIPVDGPFSSGWTSCRAIWKAASESFNPTFRLHPSRDRRGDNLFRAYF
jgi:hypothetical protein